MPRDYDPRRYGPLATGSWEQARAPRSAPAKSEVLERRDRRKDLALAASLSRQGSGVGCSPLLVPTQVLAYDNLADVLLSLPEDVSAALGERSGGGGACCRRPDKQQTTRERSSSSDQFCGKFTASTATTELASTGLERGRTRERSLSWHFRERLPVSSPAGCTPRRLDDVGFRAGSETGRGEGGAQAGAMKKEEMMAADGDIDRRRSVSIDANQLFRRKKKFTYNVTYRRWAESYDRSMAKRALLERRERAEVEREADVRRRRAYEEFQKWLWNHTRPASAARPRGEGERQQVLRKGQRVLGDRELEAGGKQGSPVRGASPGYTPSSWREGLSKKDGDQKDTKGREDGESKSAGADSGRDTTDIGGEAVEKKRGDVDRAFRKWLHRKSKQAQSEREARRKKEDLLEDRRKLEVSRRWKKRPVVCAYTYGAKIGAREWSPGSDGKTLS